MKPLSLLITNFRSIKKQIIFAFPQEASFNFLCGINEAEPRLEANGTGKSTIWDAFCWVCFNKTSRGLKAGDVCNWEVTKGCKVSYIYHHENQLWNLTRTWGPISWQLENSDTGEIIPLDINDSGNLFYSHLKLAYTPFLNSVLIAQSENMFLDLKPTDKAILFSQVMNLDVWIDYSKRASEMASSLDIKIRDIESTVASNEGRLQALKEVDYTESLNTWQDQQKTKTDLLEADYIEKTTKLDSLASKHKECQLSVEATAVGLSTAQRAVSPLRVEIDQLVAKREEHIDLTNKNKGSLSVLRDQKHYIDQHDSCTKCFQPISSSFKKSNGQELTNKINALLESIETSNDEIAKLSNKIDEKEKLLRTKEVEIDTARRNASNAGMELATVARDIKHLNTELDTIERQLENLLREENPFKQRQLDNDNKIIELEDKIIALVSTVDAHRAKYRLSQYWVKGFKEIRLYLISEAMQQLEIEVNSCLSQLGLADWKIKFDIDRETKSGDIQKGFNVKIISPHNTAPVPWESWSGGESQRLRIAATMGLANLIKSSTGSTLNLEVWDEPTQHMSEQGVTDLLDSLAERARNFNKQIWIVDHRSLGYGNFDTIRTITKTDTTTFIK